MELRERHIRLPPALNEKEPKFDSAPSLNTERYRIHCLLVGQIAVDEKYRL